VLRSAVKCSAVRAVQYSAVRCSALQGRVKQGRAGQGRALPVYLHLRKHIVRLCVCPCTLHTAVF
jgi:hypothetical protein